MGQRPTLAGWLGLPALGLVLWSVITYTELIGEILLILFAAFLLNLAIRPAADFLGRWHIPRAISIVGVYFSAVVVLVNLGARLVPLFEIELAQLQQAEPALLKVPLLQLQTIPALKTWLPSVDSLAATLIQQLDRIIGLLISAVTGAGSLTLHLFVIVVLAYFFATDTGRGQRLLQTWVPAADRPRLDQILGRLQQDLTRWVWAQVVVALYFGLTFSLGLELLGVPFALTIGLIGGALELMPYLGGFIALSLALLSALTVSPELALWVLLLYIVVTQIQAHILAPVFFGRAMGLSPAVVLLALLTGAKTLGILGLFFATPVTVVLSIIFREIRSGETPTVAPLETEPQPRPARPIQPQVDAPKL